MSLSALLEQQRQDIERARLASSTGARSKPVLFPRDYLSSRQGGTRPLSRSSLEPSPLLKDGSPPRSFTPDVRGGVSNAPKSHLTDALNLTLSILRRYKREHLPISPEDAVLLAEVAAFNSDAVHTSSTANDDTPNDQPLGKPDKANALLRNRRGSRDLLNKVRGIVHNPQLYRDMVSMKTSVKNLTQFAIECSSQTTSLRGLYDIILEQLQACFTSEEGGNDAGEVPVELLVIDIIGRDATHVTFVNIAMQDTVTVAPDDVMCRVGSFSIESSGGYLPIVVGTELFAVARFPGVAASTFTERRQQMLNAVAGIAGLTLRTAMQFERIELQANKNAEMLEMVRNIASANNTQDQVVDTIMVSAKKLVGVEHCNFHFVIGAGLQSTSDGADEDIESSLDMPETDGSLRSSVSMSIANGVFKSGTAMMVNNIADSHDLAEIERVTGFKLRNVLCLPVKDDSGTVIGVAQLSNKEPRNLGGVEVPQRFSTMDETLFSTYASFATISLGNARSKAALEREMAKSEAILDVVKYLSNCDIRDVNSVVAHVMQGAKNLVSADRASLFLIDEERHELFSKVADSTGGKEIRFPIGKGIAGTVAETGVAELIDEAYLDERFNREVDKQLGYRTRSILTEPIRFRGDILAVAQLVNKVDPTTRRVRRFTPGDQETFRTFALFAGISLSNSRLLEFVIRAGEEAMALNQASMDGTPKLVRRTSSMAQITVTDAERSRVRNAPLEAGHQAAVTTNTFNLFEVRESGGSPSLARDLGARAVAEVFKATGFLEKFNVDETTLYNFIIRCRMKYRNVPYHNFFHAVDAVQTVYTYLFVGHAKDKLTDLEAYVLLIAALCHDLDHMGLNNNFHLKTDSPLGILSSASGNKSVLEVHHCNLAVDILQDPTSNMFEGLDKAEIAVAYRSLIDCILATDMARHGELLTAFGEMSEEGFDMTNREHRTLLMQMLLKAADISNVTKPFDISRLWAISVTEEFYQQGDKEREQGVEVNPMFDRKAGGELAKGQLGFIGFVAEKFFKLVTDDRAIPGMKWCLENLQQNTATWKSMLTA